jgi:hypothetical protein
MHVLYNDCATKRRITKRRNTKRLHPQGHGFDMDTQDYWNSELGRKHAKVHKAHDSAGLALATLSIKN